MKLRSKLFATVALPVLSAAVMVEPVSASAVSRAADHSARSAIEQSGVLVAQAAVTCSDGSQAADQSACDAIDAQRAAEQKAAEDAQRAAEQQAAQEAQRAAEQQAAEEAQRAAEQQAAEEAQKAAEQQAAEEAKRAAEQQAAEEAQKAAEQQAAEEAQRAAEQQAAEEAQKAAEQQAAQEAQKAAEQQAAEEAQKAAEQQAAEEAKKAAEQQAAEEAQKAAEQQAAGEAQKAAEQQAAQEAQKAAEQQAAQEAQKAAEQKAAEDAQKAAEQQAQQPAAAEAVTCADGSQAASADACPPAQTAAPAEQAPAEQQQTDQSAGQPAGEPVQNGQAGGEQVVVPAVEPPAEVVVPEVVDTRTEEQKQQIAEDPAKTAETVVLPVDNGAAVLDSDKDADNSGQADVRDVRTQAREEAPVAPPPESDAAAQADAPKFEPKVIEAAAEEKGKQLNAAPAFQVPTTVVNNITNVTNVTNVTNNTTNNTTNNNHVQNNVVNQVKVIEQIDNRTVINVGNEVVVRGDDRPRLRYDAQETYYEQLSRGRSRETIERGDGSRLVTIYNRYGDIILRSRFTPDGEEYVLVYSPEADSEQPRVYVDVGYSLPPMRLTVPVNDYIVTMSNAPDRDYYDFLARPPVERVERVYSLDEVKSSARLRDKVRRIDLDTITFPSGSAEVPLAQAKTLRKVADAIQKVLEKDPGEVFLIEGHTDAVGSDRSNLVLSDQRAETVANLLTEVYGIPPENMSTQGYGERYLKIRTQVAEQQNRRVTIRRVTPLVRPANVANR